MNTLMRPARGCGLFEVIWNRLDHERLKDYGAEYVKIWLYVHFNYMCNLGAEIAIYFNWFLSYIRHNSKTCNWDWINLDFQSADKRKYWSLQCLIKTILVNFLFLIRWCTTYQGGSKKVGKKFIDLETEVLKILAENQFQNQDILGIKNWEWKLLAWLGLDWLNIGSKTKYTSRWSVPKSRQTKVDEYYLLETCIIEDRMEMNIHLWQSIPMP